MDNELKREMDRVAGIVSTRLEEALSDAALPGETVRPERLTAAMRHGALNGGKRVRPFLVIRSAALFGIDEAQALDTACSLEALHCFSLVHDDLPAMDDDDLRRGQPTVHKAFDEATAILAGDALLTVAFDLIASDATITDPWTARALVSLLARASGPGGMIGGQMLDIEAETDAPDDNGIRQLQAMKTGALIRYACESGAVLGHASDADRKRLHDFGAAVGLAFQLADDLLDVTSDAETMGKATGKDADKGKGTLVGLHGVEKVRAMLDDEVARAIALLEPFGDNADLLRATARFIAERDH